jgi:hypothetical protein
MVIWTLWCEHTPPQIRSHLFNSSICTIVGIIVLISVTYRLSPGQIRVFDRISWRGHIDYRQQPWQPWSVGDGTRGTSGGYMKNSNNLKFVTFQNAGHMVPGDDPAGASAILTQWLSEH